MTEEIKCDSYHTTEGLKFCMSSVCEKKDCIYHLMNDLYQKNDRLQQDNEKLKLSQDVSELRDTVYTNIYRKALEEIKRVINLAHRVEDYQLGQDYTDLVNRIDKELEVLK